MFEEKPEVELEPAEAADASELEPASPGFRLGALAVALLAFVALFGYSIHERNLARQLAGQNDQGLTSGTPGLNFAPDIPFIEFGGGGGGLLAKLLSGGLF